MRSSVLLSAMRMPHDLCMTCALHVSCTLDCQLLLTSINPRFENLHAHGLGFNRRQWLAAGDSQCCLVVSKLDKRT